ncbi:hypothetical protein J4G08_07630 [Candidatus Poribacteria bacterium]|nr:hypothetical protein [Candidatus Poribacteria bacterium]
MRTHNFILLNGSKAAGKSMLADSLAQAGYGHTVTLFSLTIMPTTLNRLI